MNGERVSIGATEQLREKWNGQVGGWSYTCHVNQGIDFAADWYGINRWDYYNGLYGYGNGVVGVLAQWSTAGSYHTGECTH